MNLSRIEIRYRAAYGSPRSLAVDHPSGAIEISGRDEHIGLDARFEYSDRGIVARAKIKSMSASPIALDSACLFVATGFDRAAQARFFKHGYQSWSGSIPVRVGAPPDERYEKRTRLTRVNHQSEVIRPPEAPEGATSELFTIVERSNGERALAGFLDGASSLSTLTVQSPDLIAARVLLDGVELAEGGTRDLAPLYFTRSREPAAQLAARWAAKIGDAMRARTRAPFQRGWCSWYHYFHTITEDALRANLRALATMRSEFPIEVVQLDDGFQAALGDWDETNEKFPSGLEKVAAEIRTAGFAAGIWTAPFLAARDSRVMRTHPEWFIRHESGEPTRAGYNPNWTRDEDKFAYAMDPSHPAVREHLVFLFRKLVHQFGYSYLKLDFLYAAAAEGRRHDGRLTRAETLRAGLDAIRDGAGDDAFILGCGCPLGTAIGVVDGMRIGPDVSPYWGSGGAGDPSTVHALDAIIARSFMHRRLWLNDPDCLMLRARDTQLTADERLALASVIASSGGMLLISDDMALLGEAESKLFRDAAALAVAMDRGAERDPILALDLMDDGPVRGLIKHTEDGSIAMALHRGDSPQRFPLSTIGHGTVSVRALGGNESPAGVAIELSPHSARMLRASWK
jgi:alpha-galactosidase